MLVRPTMRASSLEVNNVSGVSGFVLPGDRVDVLTTVDGRGANEDAITRTVLQNVEVLAAGQKTEQKDNKPITVQSVTLLVNPDGAETLALALHEGKIHLVLRNPDDQELVQVASLSTREMLDRKAMASRTTGVRRAAPTPPAQVAYSRPAQPEKVRLIKGSAITTTPAVEDSTGN
jgi:pilus assembly protein CpaB